MVLGLRQYPRGCHGAGKHGRSGAKLLVDGQGHKVTCTSKNGDEDDHVIGRLGKTSGEVKGNVGRRTAWGGKWSELSARGTWKICLMHRWCRQTDIQERLLLMMATRTSFVEGYVFHLYPGDMWIWLYGPSELHGKQKSSQPLRDMMRDEWSQQPVSQLHIFPWAPTLVWTDCRAG